MCNTYQAPVFSVPQDIGYSFEQKHSTWKGGLRHLRVHLLFQRLSVIKDNLGVAVDTLKFLTLPSQISLINLFSTLILYLAPYFLCHSHLSGVSHSSI